jgi:hypothetical protein
MTAWPIIKTAKMLVAEGIVPWPERKLVEMVKKYGVGRKEGRTYIFTPSDIVALLERLPCPSPSNDDTVPQTGTSAGPSGASALTKALALATAKPPRKSVRSVKPNCSSDRSTVIPLRAPSPKLR